MHPRFVEAWSWLLYRGLRPGDGLLSPAIRMHAHKAANTIIGVFLNDLLYTEYNSICFIDDDHVFPSDTLEKLRSNPDGWKFDILSGLHGVRGSPALLVLELEAQYNSTGPYDYFAYKSKVGWRAGDVVEVDGIGLGFTLLRRHVFERIAEKWPGEYYQFTHKTICSNDLIFSRKARDVGLQIGVDTGVRVGHLVFDATAWPTPPEGVIGAAE
ncbi:MAG: hypothetical protein ACE5HE_08865 [Phycisphaerae bacterium]